MNRIMLIDEELFSLPPKNVALPVVRDHIKEGMIDANLNIQGLVSGIFTKESIELAEEVIIGDKLIDYITYFKGYDSKYFVSVYLVTLLITLEKIYSIEDIQRMLIKHGLPISGMNTGEIIDELDKLELYFKPSKIVIEAIRAMSRTILDYNKMIEKAYFNRFDISKLKLIS